VVSTLNDFLVQIMGQEKSRPSIKKMKQKNPKDKAQKDKAQP